MLADETGLQVFEPDVDDDSTEVDGDQRALARLEQVAEDARDFAARARAPNTLKAYRSTGPIFLNGARCIASSTCPPRHRRWRCT